jgi:hypothetical protein
MNKLYKLLFLLLFPFIHLSALDLWIFPEAAAKNTLFLDIRFASLSPGDGFTTAYPEYSLDFLLPLPLPCSLGAFIKTPDPNLKSFGLRAAYHITINDPKTDLYALYVFELGFLRKDLLEQYNDTAPPRYYYDFRAGIRYAFGRFFCLSLESAAKFRGIHIGIAVKIH